MTCTVKLRCLICGLEKTKNNYYRHINKCNGIIKSRGKRGGWNKGLTKDIDKRVANNAIAVKEAIKNWKNLGHKHSKKTKIRLSQIAKERGLGGHTSKYQLKFETKFGKTIFLQSSYEIRFATLLEELNINWSRPKPFKWIDDKGVDHKYYPDFKIGKIYIDTKNDYLAKKDARKIQLVKEQNNIDLRIVTEDQINKEYIALLI